MNAPALSTPRGKLLYEIAKVIADARADKSPNEMRVCFEAAEKIRTLTDGAAR